MKFAFIDANKAEFTVKLMCVVFGVSESGYFAWRGRGPSKHSIDDVLLGEAIRGHHEASRETYGAVRVQHDLRAAGRRVGRTRIRRLMRRSHLTARKTKQFKVTTDSKHSLDVAPNVLARDFFVAAPNRRWVTDITYIATKEGWLYVAAIVDLFSRRVVGWAASDTMETRLCLDALQMALKSRGNPVDVVHHSDRGVQYASAAYRAALAGAGAVCSMSRKGDCWDNAVAESFWSTLKTELLDVIPSTRAAARLAVFGYIEGFYNHRRRHSTIGYSTPSEFEERYASRNAA
jgi:putative transposase